MTPLSQELVVGSDDESLSFFLIQLRDQMVQFLSGSLIQVAGWLIRYHD
jgi:hypothetical protein